VSRENNLKEIVADDTLDAIRSAEQFREQSNEGLRAAVLAARAAGKSWAAIGAALGCTRQAAQQRFGEGTR